MSAGGGPDGPRCDNCDRDADELVVVRRVYVTPESWDTPASEQVLDDVERWCVSCCSQYPHDVAGGTDAATRG